MNYIPSPTPVKFDLQYTATVNKSGRMQYHKIKPGISKLRIDRAEFIEAYNNSKIISIKPLQLPNQSLVFQFEFYI